MTKKAASIEIPELIQFLRQELDDLPDQRKPGNNTKYKVEDAVMAAFSVFFTQSPSFLEHQRLMKSTKGKDNAESLFSLNKIPCDNQIRNLLDPVPASKIFVVFKTVYQWLETKGIINKFRYLDNDILIAFDGTEYFSSQKINCPQCSYREHKNGTKTYFHQVITPVIVSPERKQVINLEPEFIRKQDGKTKQDCENEAAKRWLERNPIEREKIQITLLGDDLYSRQPICELAINQGYNFIFVCLPSSHKALYEWVDFLDKNGEVNSLEKKEYNRGKKLIYRYRYVNKVPLRETQPSLFVNWCELIIIDSGKNEIVYQNNFVTLHEINNNNIEKIVKGGRSRWKIENEGNNVLKNRGYNLEHNFGHGEKHLCEILLSLNLLAFLFHNVLDLVNSTYQKIRGLLVTITTFFNDIRTLLKYFWFKDWQDLFLFILSENVPIKKIDSS
jgi:hypothetical protein